MCCWCLCEMLIDMFDFFYVFSVMECVVVYWVIVECCDMCYFSGGSVVLELFVWLLEVVY